MDGRIGEIAGEVYEFLEEEGKTSVSGVASSIDVPRTKVNMAIGWLAREGKLEFNEEGRGKSLSLS